MKCPVCGAAELVRDTRDVEHIYKGRSTMLAAVTGDFCPACHECVMSTEETRCVMQLMNDFSREVNAGLVEPGFIGAVRRKLDLDQREAAELFGGGVNAFSRYETGKTQPPLALVQLLRLLDRHPHLLKELRGG